MKLGTKVHCKSYLKKESDGIYLDACDGDNPVFSKTVDSEDIKVYARGNEGIIRELGEWCGDGIEKTYRRKIECEFDGIYVGTVIVKVKGMIGTDWAADDLTFTEYGYFFKTTTETAKCGVVYYRSNKKRYVPFEDMEESKEE